MENISLFKEKLRAFPVIAILRGVTPSDVEGVCGALAECGFTLAEIPLNSPEALESIRLMSARFERGGPLMIGAGTVLTEKDAEDCAKAGARYIISPDSNPSVIRKTKELGLVSIPGFLTPTEGFSALRAGADFLKCFPCGALGPSYLKDLRAVIKAPVIAVGGVGVSNIMDFLKVSAGVGIGSDLFKPGKTLSEIRASAENYAAAVRAFVSQG